MKKHLPVILFVVVLLAAVSIIGKHQDRTPSTGSTSSHGTPKQQSFNKQLYSLTDPTSLWVVVNKQRPLNPKTYAPADLASVGNGQQMRAAPAAQLLKLFTDAKAAGFTLVAESGYRSYDKQAKVYNSELSGFGQTKADNESARPGYSEHQTGWAVDIGSPGCYEDCFGTKPASKWLLANAYKYGFILRYPASKSAVTGYRNEPWHFRYIGTSLAGEMNKDNILTLEEFFGLPSAPSY